MPWLIEKTTTGFSKKPSYRVYTRNGLSGGKFNTKAEAQRRVTELNRKDRLHKQAATKVKARRAAKR